MAIDRKFHRLLLTGAAGGLGKVLREGLKPMCEILRLSDRAELGKAGPGEEIVRCDLSDKVAVHSLVQDCGGIVHFGGVSVEDRFDPILQSNIVGVWNVYEAARKLGVKRVVFASSNHVTGFYKQTERIDATAPLRPDGLYGLSKCFGENLSRFYFDRYGIETVCLRIGSSFPLVKDHRMLATFLSYADLITLVRAALFTPDVGHTVVYGHSNNRDSWWDNRHAAHLGWAPEDSADDQRERVESSVPLPPDGDPSRVYQGGAFVVAGPFDE